MNLSDWFCLIQKDLTQQQSRIKLKVEWVQNNMSVTKSDGSFHFWVNCSFKDVSDLFQTKCISKFTLLLVDHIFFPSFSGQFFLCVCVEGNLNLTNR